jgi:dTDP-4-amino-4,6-dideoxygalactose transaminase
MIILSRVFPSFKGLFFDNSLSSSFKNNSFYYYKFGRYALLSGLVALGLKRGDSIIVPAYMCSSTIAPLREYGFQIIFIDIDKSLSLPVDVIKKTISKDKSVKALLSVHYFGLTKNLDKIMNICQNYDVRVVEDASHSFFSQFSRELRDIRGDIEIFSMRKSFPVADGGVLRINNGNLIKREAIKCLPIVGEIQYLAARMAEKIAVIVGINIYGKLINSVKNKVRNRVIDNGVNFNSGTCQASWQLRRYLSNDKYLERSQYAIVSHFNQLNYAFSQLGFRLFVESVKEGVTPQACVVYDDKGGLVEYLRLSGIGAWKWPGEEMPKEVSQSQHCDQYPNTIFFNENLVLIPVHQSLRNKQIDYIIQVFSKWKL